MGSLIRLTGEIYGTVCTDWNPRAIFRWLPVLGVTEETIQVGTFEEHTATTLTMGFSAKFLQPARLTLLAFYTAGPELQFQAQRATSEKRYLDAYIIEIIALTVLEKVGVSISRLVENTASQHGWKVGPFLSPGSVHGWELSDQVVLRSLLPLHKVDIDCSDNGILSPFNSVSCVIGIGPEYTESTVGSTCQVCSNRSRCTMHLNTQESSSR